MDELKDIYNKFINGFVNVRNLENLGFALSVDKFNLLNAMNILIHQNNNIIKELTNTQKEKVLSLYNKISTNDIFN